MAAPTGRVFTVNGQITGGVAPFTYTWDIASTINPAVVVNNGFVNLTPVAPIISIVTPDTVSIQYAGPNQYVSGLLRCKITDSTGGIGNPATNLVTYAYFWVNYAQIPF